MWVTGRRDERGSASLLVLSAAGVILLLCLVLVVAGRLFLGHRQARTAADLAALAGATAIQTGGNGCDVASRFAQRNGALVESCQLDGDDVIVVVAVAGPSFRGAAWQLRAQARAGPERE